MTAHTSTTQVSSTCPEIEIGDNIVSVKDSAPFSRDWFLENYTDPVFRTLCDDNQEMSFALVCGKYPTLIAGGGYVGLCEKKNMDISEWDRALTWKVIKNGKDASFYLREQGKCNFSRFNEIVFKGICYRNLQMLKKLANCEGSYPVKFKDFHTFFIADLGKWVVLISAIHSIEIGYNDMYFDEAEDIDDIWS